MLAPGCISCDTSSSGFTASPGAVPASTSKSTQAAANNSRIAGLRSYLAGILPGLWQGDHVAETNHITGWNYVAITALARQCSQAHQVVWQTEDRRQIKKRLALLKQSGQSVTAEAEQPRRRRLDDSHPLVRLLDKPNAAWSGAFFRYSAIQQLKATGTALVWIRRNGFGVPVEMWIIPTALARPMPPSIEYPFGSYWVTPIGSWRHYQDDEGFTPGNALGNLLLLGGHVDAREVKPVRWPHPLYPSDGLAPMSAGSVFVDVVEQSWRQRFYSLKNSAVPGMVFTVDDEDAEPSKEDKEAFREQLSAQNAGTPNAGRFLIVPAGLKPDQMERSPVEMDYANSEEQLRDANLALYAVPPIACGISQAGSYAAFYAALLQMTELAVQPELDLLGEELTEELGQAYGPGRREIKYEAKRIDDPDVLDKQTRTQSVVIDSKVKSGCYTVDEIREFWGDEPVDDKEWGKQPAGVKRSEKVGAEQDAAPGTGDPNKPDATTTSVPDPVREAMPKSFEENKHPRASDGKFGEGSGNAAEKPAEKPKDKPKRSGADPNAALFDRGPAIAAMHGNNMRALVSKTAKGEYEPDDALEDLEIYHDGAARSNRGAYLRQLKRLKAAIIEKYPEGAIESPEWQGIKEAIKGSERVSRALIDDMTYETQGLIEYKKDHPDAKFTKNDIERLGDLQNQLTDSYFAAIKGPIGDALDAFRAQWQPKDQTKAFETGESLRRMVDDLIEPPAVNRLAHLTNGKK